MRVRRCKIMGIINATPDSFFDGGKYNRLDAAFSRAEKLIEEGADLLDIGGESTRPGSAPVEAAEEILRTVPLIRRLARRFPHIPLSIDTQKSAVARRALDEGARVVNDVSALRADAQMVDVARERRCGLILMHMSGTPQTMQRNPRYRNVTGEVKAFLKERVRFAVQCGILKSRIWVDPGIGFGKTLRHNLELLGNLKDLSGLGCPLLVGTSRKSFLGRLAAKGKKIAGPEERLEGSLASAAWAYLQGASILRVHDVLSTKKTLDLLAEIRKIRHTEA